VKSACKCSLPLGLQSFKCRPASYELRPRRGNYRAALCFLDGRRAGSRIFCDFFAPDEQDYARNSAHRHGYPALSSRVKAFRTRTKSLSMRAKAFPARAIGFPAGARGFAARAKAMSVHEGLNLAGANAHPR